MNFYKVYKVFHVNKRKYVTVGHNKPVYVHRGAAEQACLKLWKQMPDQTYEVHVFRLVRDVDAFRSSST